MRSRVSNVLFCGKIQNGAFWLNEKLGKKSTSPNMIMLYLFEKEICVEHEFKR